MNVEIINIGDELLIGQVVNTNASYIAKILNSVGIAVKYITVISDDTEQIRQSVIEALNRVDCVLITGGLGPTKDDVTKYCLNELFGGKLVENRNVSKHIKKIFEIRNLPYTNTNRSQSFIPDCCKVIFNSIGTAPGMVFNKDGKLVVCMPGVPFEMEQMMEEVVPMLLQKYKTEPIIHRTIMLTGISESFLSDKLGRFEKYLVELNRRRKDCRYTLAYLPCSGIMKLRFSVYGANGTEVQREYDRAYKRLRDEIREYIIANEDKDIAQILGDRLISLHQTLAIAESCTGGNIAHQITLSPGASLYFKGGVVSYCNEAKIKVLGIEQKILNSLGAVNENVAKQMAEGVLHLYDTDFAISTTGIAGPETDGSLTQVGTVYIAIASQNKATVVERFCLPTNRSNFIDCVTNIALSILLKKIQYY
ncbi:MAG: CinA family nicotinamide mononucleotide deamidase-related protein [Bacteroidales bacterium]